MAARPKKHRDMGCEYYYRQKQKSWCSNHYKYPDCGNQYTAPFDGFRFEKCNTQSKNSINTCPRVCKPSLCMCVPNFMLVDKSAQ